MKSLQTVGFATLLSIPFLLPAEDIWAKNHGYLKSTVADCATTDTDRSVCRNFIDEALKRRFSIGTFRGEARRMRAVEIECALRNSPDQWSARGSANVQGALDKARELAGSGKAVVAVQAEDDRGQGAIVVPGPAVPSGKWALQVPIGVGARVDRPDASVYDRASAGCSPTRPK